MRDITSFLWKNLSKNEEGNYNVKWIKYTQFNPKPKKFQLNQKNQKKYIIYQINQYYANILLYSFCL